MTGALGVQSPMLDVRMYDFQDKEGPMRDPDAPRNWVKQWRTARILQGHNDRVLRLAAEAGLVYWLTGEEKYAEFTASILWTYMHGMSYRKLARVEGRPATIFCRCGRSTELRSRL